MVGAAERVARRALEAAREARLALAPRPVGEWAGLAVCRDVYPRIHRGAGRKITVHADPGHTEAMAAVEADLAVRKAATRGAVPAALAAAARSSADTLVDPSLVAALHSSLGVMPVVRYVSTPETRHFLLEAARRCNMHRLELRWTKPLSSMGESAVASERWEPGELHPTLVVPPPQRVHPLGAPLAQRPCGEGRGGGGCYRPGKELRIEPRPVAVLCAVLAPRLCGGTTRLFERSRALDPVEERPGGAQAAMDTDHDQRAAFEHGEAQSVYDHGLRQGPAPEGPVAPWGQLAPILFLRY